MNFFPPSTPTPPSLPDGALTRLSYTAPEAAAGDGQPAAASDVWSFGVILNEMVMGKVRMWEPGGAGRDTEGAVIEGEGTPLVFPSSSLLATPLLRPALAHENGLTPTPLTLPLSLLSVRSTPFRG